MAVAWTDEGIGEWWMGPDTQSNHWDTWHLCGLPAWCFCPSVNVTEAPNGSSLKPVLRLQGWVRCAPVPSLLPVSCGGCSVAQTCLTFCDPTDCSMPGFPVFYRLLELVQTHVHWVSDAIQPSHPLSPPSPPAFNLSQVQDIFQWVGLFEVGGQSIGTWASASVPPMNSQDWFPLELPGLISSQSKGLPGVLSNTTVQKHQFFNA